MKIYEADGFLGDDGFDFIVDMTDECNAPAGAELQTRIHITCKGDAAVLTVDEMADHQFRASVREWSLTAAEARRVCYILEITAKFIDCDMLFLHSDRESLVNVVDKMVEFAKAAAGAASGKAR